MMKKSEIDFSSPLRQSYVAIVMIIYRYYKIIIRQLIPIFFIVFIGGRNNKSTYFLWLMVGIALLAMAIAIIDYFRFYFHIKDDELRVQKGILTKKNLSIPFDRIQTVNLEQNLIHQVFNVVKVVVDTAGSNQNEFEFEALGRDKAEALRNLILSYKSETSLSTPEATNTDTEMEEEILSIDVGSLIKIGITENHIRSGSLIIIFLFWIQESLDDIGINVLDYGDRLNLSGTLTTIIFFVIVFFILAFFVSLIKTVLVYFNLKLNRRKDGFNLVYGLLNRKQVAALDSKIQMISWSDNLLKKLLGYHDLQLKQASSIAINSKKSIRVPGCKVEQVEQVASSLYNNYSFNQEAYHTISKKYFYRIAIYLSILGAIALAASFLLDAESLRYYPIIICTYFIITTYFKWRKTKYAYNQDMIKINTGIYADKATLIPIYKIQAMDLKQNLYQRRNNLASLKLYTASGSQTIPYIAKTSAQEIMNYFTHLIEVDKRKWM